MGEAVATGPVRTLRTLLSIGVVDPFFVRTADNPVGNYGGAHSMFIEEARYLGVDRRVKANVVVVGAPTPQKICITAFAEENGNSDLTRPFRRRSVQGDGGGGIAAKSALR